tara:strand:+ start:107 stop:493 length:387 start_codon:yes stop_codon:yes gene_type:complete
MTDFLIPIDELAYNPKSSDSIIKYAKRLTNKTLNNSCDKNLVIIGNDGKGDFGTLTEKYYFRYKPNSNPEADFPKPKESLICHVRPHGRDSMDMYPLPVEDKKLKVKEYSKQCFWLKNKYISEIYKNS